MKTVPLIEQIAALHKEIFILTHDKGLLLDALAHQVYRNHGSDSGCTPCQTAIKLLEAYTKEGAK